MRNLLSTLLLALALLAGFSASADAQPARPGPFVTVTLTPEYNVIEPGQSLWVAIRQDIAPGWHTYYLNPGDSGAEPRIQWSLPDGMSAGMVAGTLHWPAPERIPYAGLVNYGYEGSMTLLQEITAPPALPDGALALEVQFEILVCKDICIPEISKQTLVLNDPETAPADHSETIERARDLLPKTGLIRAHYASTAEDFILTLSGDEAAQIDPASIAIFPTEWGIILNPPETQADWQDDTLVLRHARDGRALAEIPNFETLLTYRHQDGSRHSALLTPEPGAAAPPADSAANPAAPPTAQPSLTLIKALLFALIGGVVLNLMPCVFPVLSLKTLKLVSLQEKGRLTAAAHGFSYTAGIMVSFALIAGLLLAVKAAGGDAGWGFQLQNPLVILALAYLLFAIGMNLSGFFDIRGAFTNFGSGWAGRQDLAGSFFTGVLATLVATPCTAPFMAGALGFALVQPAPVAMAVFLMLGLGLALPYLLLSLIPPLARRLPKPGVWMVRFKEFLAFPMYASAAWLVWVLSLQAGPTGLIWALSGMVALGFAVWLFAHRPENRIGRGFLLLTIFLALGFAVMPLAERDILRPQGSAAQNGHHLLSEDFSQSRLDQLLAEDRPVFVYLTAAWCITCKVNERVALDIPATQALFKDRNVAVLRGDWTNMNPEITQFLNKYGRSGVPLYILYPAPQNGQRPAAVILPQLLTPGLVADSLNP